MSETLRSRPVMCFEVEKVIGVSSDGSYQVQWAPAWVSKFHLVGCEHLIQEFLQQHEQQKQQQQQQQPHSKEQQRQQQGYNIYTSQHKGYGEALIDNGTQFQVADNELLLTDEVYVKIEDEANEEETEKADEITQLHSSSSPPPSSATYISVKVKDEDAEEPCDEMIDIHLSQQPTSTYDSNSKFTPHSLEPYPTLENMNSFSSDTMELANDGGWKQTIDSSQQKTPTTNLTTELTSRKHTVERPHTCDICGSSFIRKSHLNQHMFTHTGLKPFSCPQCEFTCSQKYDLTRHLRTHSGEKPFSCEICGASFAQKFAVKQHKLTHTGEKPHKCDECGKSFAIKSHLTSHMRTHTGEKPYGCDVCGKMFSQSGTRNAHSQRCSSTNTI